MTRSERPLLLGIDIEEVYDVFGEGVMIAGRGLQPPHFEMVERTSQRVRDALVDLGVGAPVVRRFEAATASGLRRAGDPLPPGVDLEAFARAAMQTGREISGLMGEIRGGLREEDAETYDLGVMLSRLDLCLRVVTTPVHTPEGERYVAVYLEELTRIVPIVDEMVATVLARAEPFERSDSDLRRSLTAVLDLLDRWDGGSASWSSATKAAVDDAFVVLGVTGQTPPVIAQADAREAVPGGSTDLETQLEDLRVRVYQLFLDGDVDDAEQGQRLLIEDCRKTVGPEHPLTLGVRNDLALTLLARGEGDLAADRALDVADEAERVFGARHPVTAHEQVRTLFVLMATKDFAECLGYSRSKLGWLEDADVRDLEPELRAVRDELFDVTGRRPE